MTLRDFASKELQIARQDGIASALRQAGSEATWKALNELVPLVERPIWSDDWDVCLILDACRVDLMREVATSYSWLPDRVPAAWSVGSASPQWISRTFDNRYAREWARTGYVTANVFSGKAGDEMTVLNEDVYPLQQRGLPYLDEVWRDKWRDDADLTTVYPCDVTDRGLWAWERRDSLEFDRLIVHYMQPHSPFVARPQWFDGWGGTENFGEPEKQDDRDVFKKLENGEFDLEEFWDVYAANLHWVLADIERWYRGTDARILISSDHGNGMGEWDIWGHPPRCAAPAVRRVPWLHVDGVDEETPETEPPPDTTNTDPEIDEQLAALGYLEEAADD